MASELWEIVRAEELRVGDVVLDLRGGAIDSYEIDPELVEIAKSSPKNFYPPKLRRYTGHHPDVLTRVIQNMHSEIRGWNEAGDYPTPTDSIDKYIAESEAEIAKERES